jgi:predicted RNA binding protein YcfA (HicA-like mRNA interferase family)
MMGNIPSIPYKRLTYMKSVNSKQVIKVLLKKGWKLKKCVGSHHNYVHPEHQKKVTVPHPKNDLPIKTFKSILNQMNITVEEFLSSL